MIHYLQCDRRDFAQLVSARAPVDAKEVETAVFLREIERRKRSQDTLTLAWRNSPSTRFSLPSFVVVDEESQRDFHAWIATYFRDIQPFSAQCRVLTPSSARSVMAALPIDVHARLGAVDLALVVAEVATYSAGKFDLSKLSFPAYERSLSFAFSRALEQFGDFDTPNSPSLGELEASWIKARELAREPELSLESKAITEIWQIVLNGLLVSRVRGPSGGLEFVKALRMFRKSGRLPRGLVNKLPLDLFPGTQSTLFELNEQSRESRVVAFEEAAIHLSRTTMSKRTKSFLLGFVASRISPGTLNHISVLYPHVERFRECLFWFGVFAGLESDAGIADFSNGLGWLLRREIGRRSSVFDRPTCDISIEDFEVSMMGTRTKSRNLHVTSNGILKIEIYPLVTTNVRWPQSQQDISGSRNATRHGQLSSMDEERDVVLMELLSKLDDSTRHIGHIRKDLEKLMRRRKS